MTLGALIVLAILQGLTEFLPVSSSGHLVLGQHLLGEKSAGVYLEVALHLGTLVSVLVVFHRDVAKLIWAGWSIVRAPFQKGPASPDPYRKLLVLLAVGTLPTALVGVFLSGVFTALFASPRLVGVSLLITGVILYLTGRLSGKKRLEKVTLVDALVIGLGQSLAITPGISRSGTTIATALFRGLDRDAAVRFSFLMAVPAIFGAGVMELSGLTGASLDYPIYWLVIGATVAAVTGIGAILSLVKILKQGKLHYFAYYVWALGLLTLLVLR